MSDTIASQEEDDLLCYGTTVRAPELLRFLKHSCECNSRAQAAGRRKTPVCIWGKHGIGKTDMVAQLAKDLDYEFAYIAPAQFEEMGDLLGMPAIDPETGTTTLRPPDWVPRSEGPGILLIDDVNRADDRILRGIMQLLQNYELISWRLPPKWQIMLTANPDGGDYSVTPMDDAMLTRMQHISLEFDVKPWARWAAEAGIDDRGISFALTYPETVTGKRTTPRSLVQFFESISSIEDLEDDLGLVKMLADASLDAETTAAFIGFVKNNLQLLVTPEEILRSDKFDTEVEEPLRLQTDKDTLRVDILSTVTTRLAHHIELQGTTIDQLAVDNIKNYIGMSWLPTDLRLTLAQELASSRRAKVKPLMADPKLSKLLLMGM